MEKIRVMFIFEMIGRPEKHIKEVMEKLLITLSEEKNIEVIEKKTHKPKKIEKEELQGELFSCFSEVELETESLSDLLRIVFAYMPSHVEVICPDELILKNFEVTDVLSEIVRRLHQYDAIAKKLSMDKMILENQLKNKVPPVQTSQPEVETKKSRKKKKRI